MFVPCEPSGCAERPSHVRPGESGAPGLMQTQTDLRARRERGAGPSTQANGLRPGKAGCRASSRHLGPGESGAPGPKYVRVRSVGEIGLTAPGWTKIDAEFYALGEQKLGVDLEAPR